MPLKWKLYRTNLEATFTNITPFTTVTVNSPYAMATMVLSKETTSLEQVAQDNLELDSLAAIIL